MYPLVVETCKDWATKDRMPRGGCFVISQQISAFQIYNDGKIYESGPLKCSNVMTPMYMSDVKSKDEILRQGVLDVIRERLLHDIINANSLLQRSGLEGGPYMPALKFDEVLAHLAKIDAKLIEAPIEPQ